MLQKALSFFNKDKHQWYGWINLEDGEVYSNLKLNDDTATMPTEEEVNAKIAELQWEENRKSAYPALGEQFDKLWHDINNGTLDNTGVFYTALKTVKDDNPKPGE
jgi:hypothetical protein